MWRTTDREQIRDLLELPPTLTVLQTLQQAMDDIAAVSPEAIATIQSTIAQLGDLAAQLPQIYRSANYGLIKADVLEWSPGGGEAAGTEALISRLVDKLRLSLGIDDDLLKTLRGEGEPVQLQATLYRS